MSLNAQPKSSGRALIWALLAVAATIGLGIPIYRASSQSALGTASPLSGQGVNTASVPPAILELFQKQAGSPPWNRDTAAKTQVILQQCAALQQLLTTGAADATFSNALAASTLRASVFMTFGESLYNSGDTHRAEMFFVSLVRDHPTRVTARQLSRCHLWIARIHKDQALAWKYQQQSPDQAAPEFQTALEHFLVAKDVDATNDTARDVGWLNAASCYHELGIETLRQGCFVGLLAETNPSPIYRDMANYLLAASYTEQHRWQDALAVCQPMYDRLTATLASGQPEYGGQANYLALIKSAMDLCTAQLAAQQGGAQ